MPINKSILEEIASNSPDKTSFDLSYSNITFAELPELILALKKNTQITELIISGNPISNEGLNLLTHSELLISTLKARDCGISSIKSFENNSILRNLDLTNNIIDKKSAEILGLSNLLSLEVAGNHLGDDEASSIAKSKTLIAITLSHNHISVKGASSLSQNKHIKKLILNYNLIQSDGAIEFSTNASLEYLCVAGNGIGENGILSLAQNNKSLTTLDVSFNFVNDSGFEALGRLPNLVYLNVGYNQITYMGAQAFVSKSSEYKKLLSLIICHNLLGNAGAIAIFKHDSLINLDMAGNGVGFSGARAAGLNKTVKCLTLSSNMLGDSGGIMLAQNDTLTELYLSYNEIGDAAAEVFAENKSLKLLNLNYNIITDIGRNFLSHSTAMVILSREQPPEFSNENLNTIFLLSESFLCISDLEGTLQFFNPAFSRALGYKNDDLLAKSAYDFLHPLDKAAQQHRGDERTPIHYFENRYQCADGSYLTIQWTSRIKGNRRYAVGANITEYRQNEKAARDLQILNSYYLLKESQDNSQRQSNFIAQISHELRNPLGGISGLLDICIQLVIDVDNLISVAGDIELHSFQEKLTACTTELKDSLQNMLLCADYQKDILNDNLDIVKISEGKFEFDKKPLDLKKVINEVGMMMKGKINKKGLVMNMILPAEKEIWALGDSLRIKQIIMNLLTNATKFTSQGSISMSLLLVETTVEFIRIQISIADTGIGMSKVNLDRIFNRFAQALHTKEGNYEGSGLGLYLAKQMTISMLGDITVSSILGKGSTFTATMKLQRFSKEEKEDLDSLTDEKLSIVSPLPVHGGFFSVKPPIKYNILIVDDNGINRKILKRTLTAAGHSCIEASNGQEAVDIFKQNRNITLILMDIQMPVKTGIEATIEIRELENNLKLKKIPIFAVTADALLESRIIGLKVGFDLYLTKPIVNKELINLILTFAMDLPEYAFARANTV